MNPFSFSVTALLALARAAVGSSHSPFDAVPFAIVALLVLASLKVANIWQKVVVRAGKLQNIRGQGPSLVLPVIDSIIAVIDERIQTTAVNAEQALTRDTVRVNVDGVAKGTPCDSCEAAFGDHEIAANSVAWATTNCRVLDGCIGISARHGLKAYVHRSVACAV